MKERTYCQKKFIGQTCVEAGKAGWIIGQTSIEAGNAHDDAWGNKIFQDCRSSPRLWEKLNQEKSI